MRHPLPALAVAIAALVASCANANRSDLVAATSQSDPVAPTRTCLARAGATIARGPHELRFYFHDLRIDQADKPSEIFTNRWTVDVGVWMSSAPINSHRAGRRWRLWAAQPVRPGTELTVRQILAERPLGSYVAYVRPPRRAVVNEVDRCLTAVENRRGRPVPGSPVSF